MITGFGAGDFGRAVAIQPDGKIVAAGWTLAGDGRFALARYNPDGTLDRSFDGDGKLSTDFGTGLDIASAVAIKADGKIVAAGTAGTPQGDSQFALARYKRDGSLDPSFHGDGKVTLDLTAEASDVVNAVAIHADGKIVVAGRVASGAGNVAVARYDPDGTLDRGFGGVGFVRTGLEGNESARGIAIQDDTVAGEGGKIVVAGRTSTGGGPFFLARYHGVAVDETPPQTLIDSGPSSPTNDPAPSFEFQSTEPDSAFHCSIDGGGFAPCTSPHTPDPLDDGAHVFAGPSDRQGGHSRPFPAWRFFTVDTVPPETTLGSGPTGTITDPEPSFELSSSEAGSSFACDLDGAGFAPCNSPHTVGPLADGAHRLRVRATDEAGNTDATPAERMFTVDTSADPRPGDPPPGDPAPEAAGAGLSAQLEIRRARVRGARPAQRRLVVRGKLDDAAAGERVVIRYRAGGEQIRLRPRVRATGSFRVSRPLRGRQRRARGGSLSVRFPGTEELRPARERLRASRRPVRLRLGRNQPRIRGSRVIVAGRVVRRARKRVRIAVEFNRASDEPAEISTRAKVNRRGRFHERLPVPPAVRNRGAWVSVTHAGRGPLHGQRIGGEARRHRRAASSSREADRLLADHDHRYRSC